MIKTKLNTEFGPVLVLGLSDENLLRMKAGQPIFSPLDEVGLPGWQVLILWGTTEDAIKENLYQMPAKPQSDSET